MWPDLKSDGAHHVEVADTPSVTAFSGAFERGYRDGEVVAVDEADVIEILFVTEGYLREGGRWGSTDSVAEEWATAVTSGATASAWSVEGAAVTTPQAAGPEGRDAEGVGLVWWELEAASS